MRNQVYFKADSTWDFDDIWIYVNNINWNYPVLRSIYGGDTTDIDVVVYNPHKYDETTNQLGTLNLDDNDIIYKNGEGNVVSDYAEILHKNAGGDVVNSSGTTVDSSVYDGVSIYDNTTVLIFTYTVIKDELANITIANTNNGLITSALFGNVDKAGTVVGGETLTQDVTHYTEKANTLDNADIIISEVMSETNYGLIITFNEREFNVTINATLTADASTDGVLDTDFVTILLVHINDESIVDHAYSVNLHNGQSYTFTNIYNGTLDESQVVGTDTISVDKYGLYEIYILYPMFYLNDTTNTSITMSKNVSYNPTLIENYKLASYTQYTNISTINNTNCSALSLGTFSLDTITRDVEISISINKPLEYWLHHSMTNM